MDLDTWLFKEQKSKTDFAKEVITSRTHIQRIIKGYPCSPKLRDKIFEASKYQVTSICHKKPKKKGKKANQLDMFKEKNDC